MFGFIILINKKIIDRARRNYYYKMYYRRNIEQIRAYRKGKTTEESILWKRNYNKIYHAKNKDKRTITQKNYYYHNKSIFGEFCKMCSNLYYI
tara:strand:- start:724 stop:1002 length:279 start_codon:yes stop_codon:yes gene_type:complete